MNEKQTGYYIGDKVELGGLVYEFTILPKAKQTNCCKACAARENCWEFPDCCLSILGSAWKLVGEAEEEERARQ